MEERELSHWPFRRQTTSQEKRKNRAQSSQDSGCGRKDMQGWTEGNVREGNRQEEEERKMDRTRGEKISRRINV